MVCSLGLGERLVGRSHQCDYPVEVLPLPVCSRSWIRPEVSGAEIDHDVKSRLQRALSLYEIDVEKIKELRPDIILTQAQCEVCAVSFDEVKLALGKVLDYPCEIRSLAPTSLADVWQTIATVAEKLGAGENGAQLLRSLKARVVDVIEKTCLLKKRPTVACIEWIEPLMAAGNWVPELVDLAGGENLFGQAGKHSPWMEWKDLVASNPEVIVAMPCGFDLVRTRIEMAALRRNPEWNRLRAVKKGRVYIVDGNQYFNRPGPRLVDSLEILAKIFHPALFPSSRGESGWEKL